MAAGKSNNVYLITGKDEYLVSTNARKLVDELVPEKDQALGLEVVDGDVSDLETVLVAFRKCRTSLLTVGFFGAPKVTWFRGLGYLRKKNLLGSVEIKEATEELVAMIRKGLPEGQTLVISSVSIDKKSALYKTCKEAGDVREYNKEDKPWLVTKAAIQNLITMFQDRGLRITNGVADAMVEKCGIETRQMLQEVDKVQTYLGDRREVTAADVEAVVSGSRESLAWEIQDPFSDRDLAQTLKVFRQLLFQKVHPLAMITMLESRIRDLLVVRAALEKNWVRLNTSGYKGGAAWVNHPELDEAMGMMMTDPRTYSDSKQAKLVAHAAPYTLVELNNMRKILVDTHGKMMRSPLPPDLLMELAIIKCIGAPRREKRVA